MTAKGFNPVRFVVNYENYCRYRRLLKDTLPPSYPSYLEVYYEGSHVGELFRGKSGFWIGVAFDRRMISGINAKDVAFRMTGLIRNYNS